MADGDPTMNDALGWSYSGIYQVVSNVMGQFSIWPDGRALPVGWSRNGFTGSEEECMQEIGRVWRDIRPGAKS